MKEAKKGADDFVLMLSGSTKFHLSWASHTG